MSTATPTLIPKACEVCDTKGTLVRCSGCKCVYYCSPEHLTSHYNAHRKDCRAVELTRSRSELGQLVEARRRRLLAAGIRINAFEPQFFANIETDRWIALNESRFCLALDLDHAQTRLSRFGSIGPAETRATGVRKEVVEEVLQAYLELIGTTFSDDTCIRYEIPGLQLALGQEQEAYDFVKWWGTVGAGWTYSLQHMNLRPDSLTGQDPLEEPLHVWTHLRPWSQPPLAHVAAVTLIKVRILLDLRAVTCARIAFRGVIPNEIIDEICKHSVGAIITSRPDILRRSDGVVMDLMGVLVRQIEKLYDSIRFSNPLFWAMMVQGMTQFPGAQSHEGSLQREAYYSRKLSYTSWALTPDALKFVRLLMMDD